MSDTARVLFPVDANTASAALRAVYASQGQVACVVVSKRDTPNHFNAAASIMVEHGVAHVAGDPATEQLQFVVIGATSWRKRSKPRPPGAPWTCVVRHCSDRTGRLRILAR